MPDRSYRDSRPLSDRGDSAGPERVPVADGPALVRFDWKSAVVGAVLLAILILCTVFKLHGSSVGMWNRVFRRPTPSSELLWGTPRNIRIDEWSLITPAMLSQAHHRPSFPVVNESWGSGRSPVVLNLPVRHWSLSFRPQYWGFFLLDVERAFAFYWTMKMVLLVGGLFLLLMLLTDGDFPVSLLGALCIYFSGFIQWWYSTPAMLPEMVGCFALAVVATHYIARSADRRVVLGAGAVLAASLLAFTFCLYPPFQIPLIFLGIALLVGSLLPHRDRIKRDWPVRAATLAVTALVVVVLLAVFCAEMKTTFDAIRNTVYPGSRVSQGGEVSVTRLFAGFFGFFMSETSYPSAWLNVCEASSFVLLFPVLVVWFGWRLARRRVGPMEWSLLVYCLAVTLWVVVGWPSVLASVTGFRFVPSTRAILGPGLAGILWCCVFVADRSEEHGGDLAARSILVAVSVLSLAILGIYLHGETGMLGTPGQILAVSCPPDEPLDLRNSTYNETEAFLLAVLEGRPLPAPSVQEALVATELAAELQQSV